MDILFLVTKLAIVVIILFWVGWPLFGPAKSSRFQWWKEELDLLGESQKDVILDTLNEIEFDHSTGKLNDEDYQELKAEYERMAVKILVEEENELSESDNSVEVKESVTDSSETANLEDIDQEIQAELDRLHQQKGGHRDHA